MTNKNKTILLSIIFSLILNACAANATPTPTASPTQTKTPAATSTPTQKPTRTPLPSKTPDIAATQQIESWNAEIQSFQEKGYISATEGRLKHLDDFREDWAQIDWYLTWTLREKAKDFVLSAHLKWSSASKTPNPSGCGFVFANQRDGDNYSIFLDQSQVIFLQTKGNRGYQVGRTRGTGTVKLETPTEADFTLIVNGYYSYVLVNGDIVGEYSLAKNVPTEGDLGIAILSGTNKDYGTRCEITDMRLWRPEQ